MSTLRIESGHQLQGNVAVINDDTVRFVAADGQTMFEVRVKDGHTIEVRAVNMCNAGDGLRDDLLLITPVASNVIILSTPLYPY